MFYMMSELQPPLSVAERARVRMRRIVELHAQATRIALQLRQETVALVEQDTVAADRPYVAAELSLELKESTGTCQRWIEAAQLLMAHPRVQALVAGQTWSIRHADAVLDELAGAAEAVQQQVLDLVLADRNARTPHQLRKAVRAARLLHDLDGACDKQDRIHDRRGVTLVDDYDGSATLMVGGTKTRGAAMLAAIDAHVAVPAPGDTRNLAQRRYDFVMDLLCGRTQVTAPWQALIVVSLETLEGGDAPAEVPGLGLVTADEAREVLAQAELRRAVVDSSGALVALDDTTLTGDQTPLDPPVPAEPAVAEEPLPIVLPDNASTDQWQWLATQESLDSIDHAADAFHADRDARREQRLLTLCHRGVRAIETHLREQALAALGVTVQHRTVSDSTPPLSPGPPEDPEPPSGGSGPPRPGPVRPGGDGRGTPTDTPPTHQEPPSWADRDWLHVQEDAAEAHDLLDQLAHATARFVLRQTRPTPLAPSLAKQQRQQDRTRRQAQTSRWTTPGLRAAVTRLRTATPNPVPAASTGYPFRGRLARWIRTRDVTCTFPGCHLLAQRCQLDHLTAYPKGKTEHCNGACECVHHHQAKHTVMTVTRQPNGTIRWTNRFGTTVDRPPRPLLRGW